MRKIPEWSLALRHEMLNHGISGAEVAKRLGVSRQWVSGILTGNKVNEKIIPGTDGLTYEKILQA